MREILFRGKRLDNGEWAYGFLVKMFGAYHIIDTDDENTAYEVILETVGQYTGTNDNHGKKIFEGDIIRKTNEGRHPQNFTANIHTHFCVNEEVYYSPFEHFTESCEYEIIGNIHDNKSLLNNQEAGE